MALKAFMATRLVARGAQLCTARKYSSGPARNHGEPITMQPASSAPSTINTGCA
jgi:hypothetical protein